MDDVIYRQPILDSYNRICESCGEDKKYGGAICSSCYLDDAISIVEDAPSAQKKGHWIGEHLKYPSGYITFIYHCSECGYEERHAYEDTKPSNFCPNCGADMRGEEDG